jgi:hypothetical protein
VRNAAMHLHLSFFGRVSLLTLTKLKLQLDGFCDRDDDGVTLGVFVGYSGNDILTEYVWDDEGISVGDDVGDRWSTRYNWMYIWW